MRLMNSWVEVMMACGSSGVVISLTRLVGSFRANEAWIAGVVVWVPKCVLITHAQSMILVLQLSHIKLVTYGLVWHCLHEILA